MAKRELAGLKFGKLTALNVDKERSKDGKIYWVCKCDCGSMTSVQSTSLTRKRGSVKSCGCARNSKEAKEKARETGTSVNDTIHSILSKAMRGE